MKLSILICTVVSRVADGLPDIVRHLQAQIGDNPEVELLYLGDNKRRKVGQKRNDLLLLAKGRYVCFVDDDDRVADDYVAQILDAIASGADVITFDVLCSFNKGKWKRVIYDANFRKDKNLPMRYERLPNHLMVVRRTLALSVGFPDMQAGEDNDFARRLKPKLKTQARINKVLYWYDADLSKSEAQR